VLFTQERLQSMAFPRPNGRAERNGACSRHQRPANRAAAANRSCPIHDLSLGSIPQELPPFSRKNMPVNAARFENNGRLFFGSSRSGESTTR
jgi:hypothetical protein